MNNADRELRPAPLAQVLAWAGDSDARRAFSPLSAQPFLLFDASDDDLPEPAYARIRAWLRELPCPSIAIAAASTALTPACDVVLSHATEAIPLLDGIRRSPIAAAVLVQLLRAIETLPVAYALTAESLAYSTLQAGPEFRRWRRTTGTAAPRAVRRRAWHRCRQPSPAPAPAVPAAIPDPRCSRLAGRR